MAQELRRLFAARLPEDGGEVRLDGTASHHARVLRLREGDPLCLFDGCGRQAEGRITRIEQGGMVCDVQPPRAVALQGRRVVLVQSLAKGDKLDAIVRMATELGVAAIHFAETARTVARPDARRAGRRLERLGRVSREAARQAGRTTLPELVPPAPLQDVAARAPQPAGRVVLWERARTPLDDCLEGAAEELWMCVGPEGGLAESEVAALRALGWREAGLGPTVLRVETAAPVAVALALDRLGGLRP